jgi:N-acetyl-anhydromuramyl-L-alanine amidase AmpD
MSELDNKSEWIGALKKALVALLDSFFGKLDVGIQEPDRPNTKPTEVVDGKSKPITDKPIGAFSPPIIQIVKGINFKTHGNFNTKSKKAKGLVVHYTVSGRSQASAKSIVSYLASQGLGCPVMDESGVIYIPEGYNFLSDVVYHAGQSSWLGVSGLSSYCIGLEICNWGTDGEKRGAKDLRKINSKKENQKSGTYQKYTEAQEKALINLCLWLKTQCPEFNIDWVVGHDEIAPNRKSDPGGSLSMTMPSFRSLLKSFK